MACITALPEQSVRVCSGWASVFNPRKLSKAKNQRGSNKIHADITQNCMAEA
jgi:hypothetical protein